MTVHTTTMPVDENTQFEHTPMRGLEPKMVEFPEGATIVVEATSLTVMTGSDENGQFIGLVAVGQHGQFRLGSITPLAPDKARVFAASIIAAANQIDDGPSH